MTASKHLGISQPSLSSQIKILSESLDLTLFEKNGRRNQLTQSGWAIFKYCRTMFEVSEELDQFVKKKEHSSTRRIRVGVSHEVDRPFVVESVSNFLKKYPRENRPNITVIASEHNQLMERLRFNELDVVFSEKAMLDHDLIVLSKAEIPVSLICSKKWKLADKFKNLSSSDLASAIKRSNDNQWVMPSEKFKLREQTNQFFTDHKLTGRIIFESDVISSVVKSVVDQIGLAFLPTLYVHNEIKNQSVKVLGPKQGYWKYHIWLVVNQHNKADLLINSLNDSFEKTLTTM